MPKASFSRKQLWWRSLAVIVQHDASELCAANGIFSTRIRDGDRLQKFLNVMLSPFSGERTRPRVQFSAPRRKGLRHRVLEFAIARAQSPAREARAFPRTYTRERLRPELRVYFTGRRLGSILVRPVPLFTSMI